MGIPTQGSGASTPWSADGSGYDPGPYDLPNDGALWNFSTVMTLFARIINGLGAVGDATTGILAQIAKTTSSSSGARLVGVESITSANATTGVDLTSGTLFAKLQNLADGVLAAAKAASTTTSSSGARLVGVEVISAANNQGVTTGQTLFALLTLLWQGKGGLASNNPWSGNQTHSGSETFTGDVVLSTNGVPTFEAGTISASATAVTIGWTQPLWIADGWNDAGGNIDLTVSDYAGSKAPHMHIVFIPTNSAHTMTIKRANTSQLCQLTGAGYAIVRWGPQSKLRVIAIGSFADTYSWSSNPL